MPYIPTNSNIQGLSNFIISIEVSLYGKPLHRDEMDLSNLYTLYLVDMGHKGLHWEPYKVTFIHNNIHSTQKVITKACNILNNLKENHAS